MNNNLNHTTAADVADQFKVSELEPRKENMWSGGHDDTSMEHATPNNCKE